MTIVRNRENGEPRGFAFVQFETKSGADKACAAAEGKGVVCRYFVLMSWPGSQ